MNKAQKQVTQAQLNREKQTIKELKQVYQRALRGCEQKIRELSERTDMENLQSIIYQKQYQEALKAQLEGVLSNLQSNSYATVSDYLTKCYRDGYTGVMYDLQKTGIPIIMPIDQAAVVRAIQTDSKLSKSLYDKMGEDVTYLKKAVRAEVSRGIANGSTWNEVAGKLSRHMANTPFQKAYNNSIRIARTEGHRIQVQSALDAQHIAKSKGTDIVKQWDATLDGATREHHQMLDGQIREVDEPFEVANLKVEAPGMFGLASEDCNCRCCLLQRARWALDDDELQTLKDRAEYFDLDKTDEFEEYQEKYLQVSQEYGKYANLSYEQKKEKIYNNERKIKKLYEQKKQEELNMIMGANADEMQKAQEKAKAIQRSIDKLKSENEKINYYLGEPQNAKERFLAQSVDISKLPQDIKENEMGAVSSWTRSDYVFINDYLRNGNRGVHVDSIDNANILKKMINRNVVTEPFTVKRGSDYGALNHLFGNDNWRRPDYNVNGKIIQDAGFMATTPLRNGGFGGEIQFYIDVPAGAKGVYIGDKSAAPDEKEFLLQAGTKQIVDRIETWTDKWNESHYDIYTRVIVNE